jgi:hypothetical protein
MQSRQQDGEVTGKCFDEMNIQKSTHDNYEKSRQLGK